MSADLNYMITDIVTRKVRTATQEDIIGEVLGMAPLLDDDAVRSAVKEYAQVHPWAFSQVKGGAA